MVLSHHQAMCGSDKQVTLTDLVLLFLQLRLILLVALCLC